MKKILLLFVLLIPNKALRKKARTYLKRTSFNFHFFSKSGLNLFLNSPVREDTILVIEMNNCHGEVVPGYAKYFLDLGYYADVLIAGDVYNENPFCRFKDHRLRIFNLGFPFIEKIGQERFSQYERIFLTSLSPSTPHEIFGAYPAMLRFLRDLPHGKKKTLVVEHDLAKLKTKDGFGHLGGGDFITLGPFRQGWMVNPHYFGDIHYAPKNKTTTFITVGEIHPAVKNHSLLLQVLEGLIAKNIDFKVIVIGKGGSHSLSETFLPHIEFRGRVNFQTLYDSMEKADFFLPLLDPEEPRHNRYFTSGVTGSAQLIYGFLTPPIIHEKFANFYGFNNKNSVIYHNCLEDSLEKAICMPGDTYLTIRKSLEKLRDDIYLKSINNLRKIIDSEMCGQTCCEFGGEKTDEA